MPELANKKQLPSTVYATSLMTQTDVDQSICFCLFQLRDTGDWDLFRIEKIVTNQIPYELAKKMSQIKFRMNSGILQMARGGSRAKTPPRAARGPHERARAETGGADQWVVKRGEFPGFAIVNRITPASLGYPRSVFIKNSTLKKGRKRKKEENDGKSDVIKNPVFHRGKQSGVRQFRAERSAAERLSPFAAARPRDSLATVTRVAHCLLSY